MAKKTDEAESLITANKNVSRNYTLFERFQAGMVLQGTEVKAIRAGTVHIHDAFGTIEKEEVFLHAMHVGPYSHGNRANHEILRKRKLLLHKSQIRKLMGAVLEKGFTLVPIRLYWEKGRVKVEVALAKGKTKGDRREDSKRRDAKREIETATKRSKR
ncbi:MAG: SsrA-binding protein SmpB [Deltaproteobacteria bacterium]|nr:SsrA-binding protein SmpB [Deltaproteobacteria bacterium]